MAASTASTPSRTKPLYDGKRYSPADSVGHQLFHLMQAMKREIELRMAEHGLTDAQWKPLWMLQAGRASTALELARCTDSDAGAMTRMVDRLEAKGLVERVRSDTDRRVVQLRLTPSGDQAASMVPQVLAAVNNDMLRGFSVDEWQQLRSMLTRMMDNALALHATPEVPA